MASEHGQRKIAAILAADVVGFSRLTGVDEDRTLARLRALRSDVIDPTIAVHHGRRGAKAGSPEDTSMMFCNHGSGVLAISQPAHAWISGQLLRAWAEPLGEPLLLAGEQHDIGWFDWEAAPTFDTETGRPHLFRHVGAATHAPMWTRGVDRALAAWGAHVALLISMHGGLIYRRFTDRHRMSEADGRAAGNYLTTQASREATWMRALRLDPAAVKKESSLVAFADALSLALCGDLKAPMTLEAPAQNGDLIRIELADRPGRPFEFVLAPWPFSVEALAVEAQARPLPPGGRFSSEAAMRSWLASPARETFKAMLFAA